MPTKLLFASDADARALPFSLSSAARYGVHVVTFEFSFVTATRSGRRARRPADSTLRRELFAATDSMSGLNRFILGGEGLGADVAAQVVEMDANPRIDGLFYLNPTFQTVSRSNRRLWKQSSLSELKAPTLTVFSKDEDGQPSPTVKAKEMSWLLADGVERPVIRETRSRDADVGEAILSMLAGWLHRRAHAAPFVPSS